MLKNSLRGLKMNKRYWYVSLFVVMLAFTLVGCGNKIDNALNWKTKSYTYTNQDGKPFGSKNLKGKVYLADFIFTNCQTVCPPITANMAKIQRMAKEKNLDVQFVSFSVDPTVDTPQKMKEFSKKFNADLKSWNFLTGYSQNDIEKFAHDNFESYVKKPAGQDQVIHQTMFFLVDQKGTVMQSYSSYPKVPFDQIINDMKILLKN